MDQEEKLWTVVSNSSTNNGNLEQLNRQELRTNIIKTTKYTWLTFLPKNLFEQFHRFANIYFLSIIILNWVPEINAFGKEVAMIPLLFVLSVTAVKDLFEDRRRYKSDLEVNNKKCKVYKRSQHAYVHGKWKDITVGDIIKLSADDQVPADILLLNSSGENGVCYVSTASLDGETNLKQKQSAKFTSSERVITDFLPSDVDFVVKCEQPNNLIHSFHGYIESAAGNKMHIDQNNLLLRGCVVRNTDVVEGLVVYAGHDTKSMLNNSGPRYKRSKMEKDINKDVTACVILLLVLCTAGGVGCGLWTNYNQEFNRELSLTNRSPTMEGFIRFWTFIIILQVIIPVSLYVSVELVKLGQVYFMNQDAEMYYETSAAHSVCRATTINEDLGQIQYVFSDKTGTLTENKMLLKKFSVQGIDCAIPDEQNMETLQTKCRELELRTLEDNKSHFQKAWLDFFIGTAICNTVVVVEEDKSVDSVGSRDNEAYEENLTHSDSCSQLRCINPTVVFKNRGAVEESVEDLHRNSLRNGTAQSEVKNHISENKGKNDIRSSKKRRSKKLRDLKGKLKYEAESPDEEALVKAAFQFGYKLQARTANSIRLQLPNQMTVGFELLQTLPFDSARKRMSVIVRNYDGKIILYCKGADSVIMNLLRHPSGPIIDKIESQIEEYAHEGLRTLCIAKKEIEESQYLTWAESFKEANLAFEDRDKKVAECIDAIENNLEILGATGVEDKLQDGVSDTIASLREAGIKVWVLTGDKQETAINIAFSCKLLDEEMEIIVLNANSKEQCNDILDTSLQRITSYLPSYTFSPTQRNKLTSLALVINGPTLAMVLEKPLRQKFIDLAENCNAVVCCRAAPIQKASVVKLVRESLNAMSLAIGDGANDVSMLQMADVGIGIVGNEGMQAVMASDFVLGRFKFLKRLILLHGHWCYDRLARMIVYFFYKNAMFVFLLFWYQLFNGFSGSNAIDDFSLILFNLIFTSAPPIVTGVLDQCTTENQLLTKPHLYKRGQNSEAYTRGMFWINMLDSLYQSGSIFILTYFSCSNTTAGMNSIGIIFHQIAVITVSLHLGIEIPNWTPIHHFFLWGSVVLSYIWFLGLCAVLQSYRTYWVIYNAASTIDFWLLTLLVPVVALAPRYVFRCVQTSLFPTESCLSKMEDMFASTNSQHSLRRFGSETYVTSPPASTVEHTA